MSTDSAERFEFVVGIFGSMRVALHAEDNANMRVGRYGDASKRSKAVLRPELNEERIAQHLFFRHDMPIGEGLAIEEVPALQGPGSR
ncbi:hypothetical protein [Bradyrhizobium sp. STM 3562]|uniref:hypothetical protein n=1 Tax=Bradyrhizobium sp. STM 3562 TaxID=578924 RepID=UPI00388DCC19